MLKRVVVCLVWFAGCGEAPAAKKVFPYTGAQCRAVKDQEPLHARVTVEGMPNPCELNVTTADDGTFVTDGNCDSVPISKMVGTKVDITIQWYVISPKLKKEITLAEITRSAELSTNTVNKPTVLIDFTSHPELDDVQTKANRLETAARKDHFNCDRAGQIGPGETPCDSNKAITQTPGADKDTCSNLEEYCNGTLFSATDDATCAAD